MTSLYEISFLSFIGNNLSTQLKFSLTGFQSLFNGWFLGNRSGLFLISLLYIIEKVSRSSISSSILIEISLLTIGLATPLSLIYPNYSSIPIILGLFISILIHLSKRNSKFESNSLTFFSFIDYKSFKSRDFFHILIGIITCFTLLKFPFDDLSIEPISSDHILRLFFIWLIALFTLLNKGLLSKQRIQLYLPQYSIYVGCAISTVLINLYNLPAPVSIFTFDCISAICLLPLIDLLIISYYTINKKFEIGILRINRIFFQRFIDLSLIILIVLYLLYVFTSG
ncbi:hypothetical protein [Prochlorococcus marinus]|uniref:hypothetical protein n=1 Tax=Prochlorococcus marinus TaxID=1219 RepID=UPI0022B525FD|nr:hypothetical protein [Prochlorococcus marinus]